jgi:uncharacterized membrane protein HdeD (DUF308 family)
MSESVSRRIAVVRAAVALVWAAALFLAVGDRIPTTASDVTTTAALLLSVYPLIDVVSSLAEAGVRTGRAADLLRVNAAIGVAAAVGLAAASFAGDAGTTLAVFGAWAVVSGAMQLGLALRRRRAGDRHWQMIVSGGLSAIVGVSFVAASSKHAAHLSGVAGYAAFGAVLYLVWVARAGRTSERPTAARADS